MDSNKTSRVFFNNFNLLNKAILSAFAFLLILVGHLPATELKSKTISLISKSLNGLPVAIPDTVFTDEDNPLEIDVLANDFDPDNDTITIALVSQGKQGSVVITENQTVEYTPNLNYFGTDFFFYNILDSKDGAATGKVTITINPVNDPPVAMEDSSATNEIQEVTIDIVSNDYDVDGSVIPSTIAVVDSTENGELTVNDNGTVTYDPNKDFVGSDTLIYTVKDNDDDISNQALVKIVVLEVNEAPTAVADISSTNEDISVKIAVIQNDSDPDGQINPGSVSIMNAPSHGSAQTDNQGNIIYNPNPNYNGMDQFTYVVNDDKNMTSNQANVTVTVHPVDDPPMPFNRLLPIDGSQIGEDLVQFVWASSENVDNDTINYDLTLLIEGIFRQIAVSDTQVVLDFRTLELPTGQPTVLWGVLASDGKTIIGPANGIGSFTKDVATSVSDHGIDIPDEFGLAQNYPNPFNPSTVIEYQLPQSAEIKILIYNIQGQLIRTLVDEKSQPGYFKTQWHGLDDFGNPAASAIYIYRIEARSENSKSFVATKKMMLLR